jgi:hypothetical protein
VSVLTADESAAYHEDGYVMVRGISEGGNASRGGQELGRHNQGREDGEGFGNEIYGCWQVFLKVKYITNQGGARITNS